jgi:hypothetical protein
MSNINPNNIDGNYPVAGQDNSSQGMRDNFTNIKNNFSFAAAEISDIQNKAILKAALTGETLDNDLAGAVIHGAEVYDMRETRVDLGTAGGAVSLNHASGHYYTMQTNASTTLAFAGLPAAGKLGRIKLDITVTNVAHTLTLPSQVSVGVSGIAGIASNVITFTSTGRFIFEFLTTDGGTTIHVDDLTRPRNVFHSKQIKLVQRTPANTGAAGDVAGMIAVDNSYVYICFGTYDGSTVIWKRAAFSTY